MDTGYMVIARDGQEYGPLDRDTIQRWYYEGRLDRNSKVYEPGKHKFRLHEMFDLTVWNNPQLVSRAASASNAEPAFVPKTMAELVGIEDHQPTPGMFAAGILLIINGVMGVLAIGLVMTGQLEGFNNPRDYIVPIIDFIVAAGLIRGNEKFRKWGLIRALLGGAFFLLGALLSSLPGKPPSSTMAEVSLTTVYGWFELIFQLIFAAGIAALLWGDWPSRKRVVIGVAAVLVAWSGIITSSLISGFVAGLKAQGEFAKYALDSASFEDDKLGISVRMPQGWALLTNDNPLVSVPGATMIAVNSGSGCFAALLVERDMFSGTSTDAYLTLVLQNRQKSAPTMKEISRSDVGFGGNAARELDTWWIHDDLKFRGFSVACKSGLNYYLLAGWCLDKSYSQAFPAFESLEKTFQIGPRSLNGPPEIASESEEDSYDLVFLIREHKTLVDGTQMLLAQGMHEGNPVSFSLSLAPGWGEGSLGQDDTLTKYTGGARYQSVGAESDTLVRALDQLYETGQSPKRMKSQASFTAMSLEGDPRDLEKGPVKLKLFFEGVAQSQYAELYTNIDLKARKLYLSEKDPSYRAAIIRALRAR